MIKSTENLMSHDEAENEADIMRDLVEKGFAGDYDDAQQQIEKVAEVEEKFRNSLKIKSEEYLRKLLRLDDKKLFPSMRGIIEEELKNRENKE